MNKKNIAEYIFSRQIYKSVNADGSIRQTVSIDIQLKDVGLSFPTPFNAFLLEYQNRKTSTISLIASITSRFLNHLFFEMESPITSIQELTWQHGIDFLSSLSCQRGGKSQYAEYLTKFYYFCKQNGMAEVADLRTKGNDAGQRYTENIFKGRYEVTPGKNTDVIHEIDVGYLPMLFDAARDTAPDIYLGLLFQFAGGLRASEVISVEYGDIGFIRDGGRFFLTLRLEDKDLRPDLSSAFISKVKRNRTQTVLPIFGDRLEKVYEAHVEHYRKEGISAVFIDKSGNPMTSNTYWKRFSRVKKEFINRLYACPNIEAQMYAVFLESYQWSTHIGRGTYSNLIAQSANNIGEIAVMRGDLSLSSSLPYLNDNRAVEKKVQDTFDCFYKKEAL